MKMIDCCTKRVAHPWRILCITVPLIVVIMLCLARNNPHEISASDYAALTFNGLVYSNSAEYGSFTITNHHQRPLHCSVNNMEIRTARGWEYYASWSPGNPGTHPILGNLHNPLLAPGTCQTFLVRAPSEGEAWRIHVGVLRGIKGMTLENRLAILLQTRSLSAALSSRTAVVLPGGCGDFRFAGLLDGPVVRREARPDSAGSGLKD